MTRRLLTWILENNLLGIAILGISIGISSIVFVTRPQASPRIVKEKAWPVSVIQSAPSSIAPNLVAFGKIESRQVAILKTSIVAPVAEVYTYEGQWVTKGDLLVMLDGKKLELAMGIAKSEYDAQLANLESVRNDRELAIQLTPHYQELKDIIDSKLQRHLNLFNNRMASETIVDGVRQQASEQAIILAQHLSLIKDFPNRIKRQQALVVQYQSSLDQSKLDLAQTRVLAPFTGRVIKTFISQGDRVLPGIPLIQVAAEDGVELRTSVSTRIGRMLRRQVKQGKTINATASIDGKQMRFTLNRISGDIKAGQSGLDAFFSPDLGEPLDLGLVVSLLITLPEEQDVVVLPIQSIYENNRIYRVEENRLVGLNIEEVGDYVDANGHFRLLVRSDEIAMGDLLVTTQLPRAITGLLVEPIDADQFVEFTGLE